MKYKDILKFLKDNDIKYAQPLIAIEVSSQLEEDISDDEFEEICKEIHDIYLDCVQADIWDLTNEVLIKRGYKSK